MEQPMVHHRTCRAPRCKATSRDEKLFRCPYDSQRVREWLVGIGLDPDTPLKVFYLCSRHFSADSFYTCRRDKLVRHASPCYLTGHLNPLTGDYCPLDPQSSCDPGDLEQVPSEHSQRQHPPHSRTPQVDIHQIDEPHRSTESLVDYQGRVGIDVENLPGSTSEPLVIGHLKSPILLRLADTDVNSYNLNIEGLGCNLDVSGVEYLPGDSPSGVEMVGYAITGSGGNVRDEVEEGVQTVTVFSGPLGTSTPLRPASRKLEFGSSLPRSFLDSAPSSSLETVNASDIPSSQGSSRIAESAHRAKSILAMIGETRYSKLTPRKQSLVQEVRKQRKSLGILKKSLKSKALKLRSLTKLNFDDIALVERFASSMSRACATIMVSQVRNSKRKPHARRWKLEDKLIAVSLYKRAPRAYRFLRTIFTLPTPRTLVALINQVPLKPGINSHVFDSIKKTVQSTNDIRSALCTLTWDEMSIKEYLEYVPSDDVVVGFEDLGDGKRSSKPAHHALVFMAVGLFHKWKQPLAYYFTPSNLAGTSLVEILNSVLSQCKSAGLVVKATICDGHSVNRKVYQLLGTTAGQPWFSYEGNKVFTMFDPPHLLKCTRNMFTKHDLSFQSDMMLNGQRVQMTAKWNDVVKAYEDDCLNVTTRNMHKITQDHLNPKHQKSMKVNLAAQIFSRSVTAVIETCVRHGVLQQRAVATAEITRFFNDLFDSVNGYREIPEGGGKGLRCRIQRDRENLHLDFWNQALEKLNSMKFVKQDASSTTQCSSVTISGWVRTVGAMKLLWTSLKVEVPFENLKYLEPRRLNQDPLENLFGAIRAKCGSNFNPTANQFTSSLNTCIINKLVDSDVKGGNCEAETGPMEVLESLQQFLVHHPQPVTETTQPEVLPYSDTFTMPKQVIVNRDVSGHRGLSCAYVSGFSVSRLLGKHSCDRCREGLIASNPHEYDALSLIEAREFSDTTSGLTYPSRFVFVTFDHGLRLAREVMDQASYFVGIRQRIVAVLSKELDFSWWDSHCLDHKQFIDEALTVSLCRIYIPWWCKLRNRAAKDARRDNYTRKMLILQHQ